jgi:hypothetical protein
MNSKYGDIDKLKHKFSLLELGIEDTTQKRFQTDSNNSNSDLDHKNSLVGP